MAAVSVFVDDAIRGDLPLVCAKTGAPADLLARIRKPVGGGMGGLWLLALIGPMGLYATKRGERPLIRAAGGVFHSTPQWRRTLSLKLSKLRRPWATRTTFFTTRFTASVGPLEAPVV